MSGVMWITFLTWTFWFLLVADFVLLIILLVIEFMDWWKERQ